MNYFDIPYSLLPWILLAIEAVAVLTALIFLCRPIRKCGAISGGFQDSGDRDYEVNDDEDPETVDSCQNRKPKVSVVVYSSADEETLTACLSALSMQDYPDFEVIVVCDASYATTAMLSEKYAEMFQRVYITFVPPGSHNLSRRKLALTLGIKAAKGDIVITTVDNAVIPSERWISLMATPFIADPQIELAIGYSHADLSPLAPLKRRYRDFTTVLYDSFWTGYAAEGKPYRADGFNMAMKKEVFFRLKGYSSTQHLHSGEDDLFVNEFADAGNTAMAISPETTLTTFWGGATDRVTLLRRSQYDFTSRWLPKATFHTAGALSLTQWLTLGAATAASLTALPSLIITFTSAAIWLLFIILEAQAYRKAANTLEGTSLSWQIPFFWLWRPVGNAIFRLSHRKSRFKNFTWQRHK